VASDEAMLAAASLSQLEKECCAFFEFSIEIGAGSRWLVVRVPEAAQDALSSFMTMLQAT
jgi:hypothetical protein